MIQESDGSSKVGNEDARQAEYSKKVDKNRSVSGYVVSMRWYGYEAIK